MAFGRVDIWQLNTGRLDDLKAIVTDANAQIGRFGADAIHLVEMGEGADLANSYYTYASWQNAAAYGGQFSDRVEGDAEWMALVARLSAADTPATWLRTILIDEVVGNSEILNARPGDVRISRGWQVKPGRAQDMAQAVREVAPYVERHGGKTALYRTVVGGSNPSTHFTVGLFPNAASVGAYFDTLATDPGAQRLFASVLGPDGPATPVFTRIDYVVS